MLCSALRGGKGFDFDFQQFISLAMANSGSVFFLGNCGSFGEPVLFSLCKLVLQVLIGDAGGMVATAIGGILPYDTYLSLFLTLCVFQSQFLPETLVQLSPVHFFAIFQTLFQAELFLSI